MMKDGEEIEGLKVKCFWNFEKTHNVEKIDNRTISEPIIYDISLLEYWKRIAPGHIEKID